MPRFFKAIDQGVSFACDPAFGGASVTICWDHTNKFRRDSRNVDSSVKESTFSWGYRDIKSNSKHGRNVAEQAGRWDVIMRQSLDHLLPIYVWNQDPQSEKIATAMSQWDDANTTAGVADSAPKLDLPQTVLEAAMNMANTVFSDLDSVKGLLRNVYKFLFTYMTQYLAALEKRTGGSEVCNDASSTNQLKFQTPGEIQENELGYDVPGVVCVAIKDFMRQYFRFWYECRLANRGDLISVHLCWDFLANAGFEAQGNDYRRVSSKFRASCPEGKSPLHTTEADELDRLVYHFSCGRSFERFLANDCLWEFVDRIAKDCPENQEFIQDLRSLKVLTYMKWD